MLRVALGALRARVEGWSRAARVEGLKAGLAESPQAKKAPVVVAARASSRSIALKKNRVGTRSSERTAPGRENPRKMALLELLLAHDEHNYAAATLVVVVVYALSAYVAKPGGAGVSAKGANANVDAAPETRAAFASFRRAYVVAFGCGLWCEFAGAAMLFAALRETYPIVVVAELFAASFAGSWASRAFLRRAAEAAVGLKGACACGLALYACSALGTAVSCDRERLYALLVASRVAAGVAQPVLQQSFEAYQRSAHAAARYPSGWRRETYEAVGFASTAASLGAGVGAEVLARLAGGDRRAPLAASAAVAAVGAAVVGLRWPAAPPPPEAASSTTGVCGGDAEAGGGFLEFRSVAGTGSRRGVVVTLSGACLDAAAYLALVAWAPVLARVDGDAPFGLVYSLAMAAAVVGTNGFALAASRKPPKFEALAAAACAVGAVAFAVLAYHRDDVPGAVAPFLLFQLAFGCSKPAFASLRGKHVPAESRDAAAKLSSAFVAGAGLALTLLYPGHPTAVFAACAAICGTAAPALALPAAK